MPYICTRNRETTVNRKKQKNKIWGISSVGSERLPYKQDVGGSNPSFPTKKEKSELRK